MQELRRKIFQELEVDRRFGEIDVLEPDFGPECFEHRLFGAIAHLHRKLFEARAVGLRLLHFGQLPIL